MSEIEEFKDKAMSDPSLLAELSALAGTPRGELIGGVSAIAARHGFTLSESEIAAAMERQIETTRPRDLNEDELDHIAAGASGSCWQGVLNPQSFY